MTFKTMLSILVLAALFVSVASYACDNQCSGHGTCLEHGVCECYDNWGLGMGHLSGDCSERICPYEFAWVDKPNVYGTHHTYSECAGRGICNRDTGDCECFDGYEGKACQRTKCPNDCSGHGRCAYIEDMYYGTVRNEYLPNLGEEYSIDPSTFSYYDWDKTKTRGCICDPEYGDVDCSKRMCQYATDVMDQRSDLTAAEKYNTHHILIQAQDSACYSSLGHNTFSLIFTSKLNETFVTKPINFIARQAECHKLVLAVQNALLSLPNGVVDGVTVAASCGVTKSSVCSTYVNVTFTGTSVQGDQYPLTVDITTCGDGCTPKLSGLELQSRTMNSTTVQHSDFNSYECGRRGKCDYSTGQCTCFSGYTGLACNTLTTLV